jgi:hypothetical protein
MSKIFSTNQIFEAPSPNLGGCSSTGKWDNTSMINDCKECVSQPDYYGEKQFYCDGQCMSKYDLGQVCSENSLVAKTVSQCENPCYQEGSPTVGGGCSDDFDCSSGQKCVIKQIKYEKGIMNRGFCEDNGIKEPVKPAKPIKTVNVNSQNFLDNLTTGQKTVFYGGISVFVILLIILIYILIEK